MKAILSLLVFGYAIVAHTTNGTTYWKRHTIDATSIGEGKMGADGVKIADVNRDLLPDVVTGWEDGNAVRMCLNPGKTNTTKPWPAVSVGRVEDVEDAVFADLDGDLRVDVISASEGKTRSIQVHWAPKNPKDNLKAESWSTEVIPCTQNQAAWMFLRAFDVDRDGDLDLITGSKGANGSVGWLVNPGHALARKTENWEWRKLASANWIMSILGEDLDGDGHREIIYSDRKGENSGIYAMHHLNTAPWVSEPVLLGFAGKEVMFIDVADLNGDGKKDIAAAIRPIEFGYLTQPKDRSWKGGWNEYLTAPILNRNRFGKSKAVKIGDFNLNGGIQIVATCEEAKGNLSGVFVFPFQSDPELLPVTATDISGPEGCKFDRIEMLDLDGDGDLDLLTSEESDGLGVFWLENPAR